MCNVLVTLKMCSMLVTLEKVQRPTTIKEMQRPTTILEVQRPVPPSRRCSDRRHQQGGAAVNPYLTGKGGGGDDGGINGPDNGRDLQPHGAGKTLRHEKPKSCIL